MTAKILIVDDDPVQQKLMRFILTQDGYTLTEAGNGREALEKFQAETPDLVLLDALMPELDGFETCQAIRLLPGGEGIPLLIVTTLNDDAAITQVFAAGATDYIAKPINRVLIRQRIRRLLHSQTAEKALQTSETYFRALIENATDIISVLDLSGVIRYQSPSVYRILGYTEAEMIGKNSFEFLHPEDIPLIQNRYREILAGDFSTSTGSEYRYRCKEGSWRVFESRARLLPAGMGPPGLIVNTRDVTERKQFEEALARSEKYHRSLIENVTDLIVILQSDGTIRYTSPSLERISGFREEEAIGVNAFTLIHWDDVQEVLTKFHQVQAGEVPNGVLIEYRCRVKGGAWHYFETKLHNFLDDPNVDGFVLSVRDVTERKHAELALKSAEARTRALVEALPDGIARIRRDGVVLDYRPNRAFGRPLFPASVIGARIQEFLPREYHELALTAIEEAISTNRMHVVEFKFPFAEQWVDLEARTVASGEHETLTLFRDITIQKTAERFIEAHLQELAEANLKLQEMDRVKSNFTAMLAHDLRSPLSVVRMALEVFEGQQDLDPVAQATLFQTAHSSLAKVLTLIDDLLEVFRSESTEIELQCVHLQPDELLGQAVKEARLAALSKHITVEENFLESPLPLISADPKQLGRVFSNLLTNAIKFTPEGGVIVVEAQPAQGKGVETGLTFLSVKITDTGQGISASDLPYIFDPYQQAQSEQKKLGVGLGLAIVKRIVAAHGGNITVSSKAGVGTCFTVILPTGGNDDLRIEN
ncbi:MAG: PAS domain S-box protein [Blastocatellia bacterium]|nr:PAS domain S-box protein [Blastocatellia bacterium]